MYCWDSAVRWMSAADSRLDRPELCVAYNVLAGAVFSNLSAAPPHPITSQQRPVRRFPSINGKFCSVTSTSPSLIYFLHAQSRSWASSSPENAAKQKITRRHQIIPGPSEKRQRAEYPWRKPIMCLTAIGNCIFSHMEFCQSMHFGIVCFEEPMFHEVVTALLER